MLEQIKNEIVSLHNFFQNYFLGTIDQDEISRFEQALAADFTIISTGGRRLTKDQILDVVLGSFNSRDRIKIWIENIKVDKLSDSIFVATYNELQTGSDKTINNRISTAIFDTSSDNISWVRVHETEIQTPNM